MAASVMRFFRELRRRKVITVALVYAGVGWALIEFGEYVEGLLRLPDWADRLVAGIIFLGFPMAVVLAWVFDITSRGIVRTEGSDARADAGESTQATGLPGPAPDEQSSRQPASPEFVPPAIDSAVASVCVLPFDNLSGDAERDGLGEGLASEIHATLSRMHRVRVASRRSGFRFRSADTDNRAIAAALNVRYILSGSIMRAGNRLRVIAELDDAETDSQIWANKFERDLDNILQVQSEISEAIVGAFGVERQRDEIVQAHRLPTDNLDAWSLVQRARHYILDYNRHSLDEAHKLLKQSLETDPEYAAAWAALGSVLSERVLNGFSPDLEKERSEACAAVNRAAQLSPHDPFVLKMSGMVSVICGDIDASLRALRGCVDLAPYDFGAWGYFGWPLAARGTPEALKELHRIIDQLLESAPEHPGIGYWLYHKSAACLCQGELVEAEKYIRMALDKHQEVSWAWLHLASVSGAQGKFDGACAAAASARSINPAMSPEHFASCLVAMSGHNEATRARTAGLRAAGLLSG